MKRKPVRQIVEGSGLAVVVLEYPEGVESATLANWLNESYGVNFTKSLIESFRARAQKKGYKEAIVQAEIAETEYLIHNALGKLDDLSGKVQGRDSLSRNEALAKQILINTSLAINSLAKDKRRYLKERLERYEKMDEAGLETSIDLSKLSLEDDGEDVPPVDPSLI